MLKAEQRYVLQRIYPQESTKGTTITLQSRGGKLFRRLNKSWNDKRCRQHMSSKTRHRTQAFKCRAINLDAPSRRFSGPGLPLRELDTGLRVSHSQLPVQVSTPPHVCKSAAGLKNHLRNNSVALIKFSAEFIYTSKIKQTGGHVRAAGISRNKKAIIPSDHSADRHLSHALSTTHPAEKHMHTVMAFKSFEKHLSNLSNSVRHRWGWLGLPSRTAEGQCPATPCLGSDHRHDPSTEWQKERGDSKTLAAAALTRRRKVRSVSGQHAPFGLLKILENKPGR